MITHPWFTGLLGLLLGISLVHAQDAPPTGGLDVIVQVREHRMGPEIVRVKMVKPGYPRVELARQIQALGRELGSNVRALTIRNLPVPAQAELAFLEAEFTVDHLLEPGEVNLQPLLRAFAGTEAPWTVHNFQIILENVRPTSDMVRKYREEGVVEAEALATQYPLGVEYRVRLLTQDAERIQFPSRYAPQPPKPVVPPAPAPDQRPLLIGGFVLAGLALGALVYLLLLRTSASRSAS